MKVPLVAGIELGVCDYHCKQRETDCEGGYVLII